MAGGGGEATQEHSPHGVYMKRADEESMLRSDEYEMESK